jgi:AcrR family transcriptional regulator
MPRVSQEYKENTRDKILDSAKRLFEQKGYHETSMDEIVNTSGMSKGAIYGYFDSKEALFESLQEKEYAELLERAERLLTAEGTAQSKLEKVADVYFLSHDEPSRDQCRMSLQFSAASLNMSPVQGKVENQFVRIHALLSTILKEGIRNGEFRKGIDTDSIASLLFSTFKGLTVLWATTGAEIDWKRVREALVKLTLDGISAADQK